MGKWKQKLRFFGGPLHGQVHDVDEGAYRAGLIRG